jgi:hypothetical protein
MRSGTTVAGGHVSRLRQRGMIVATESTRCDFFGKSGNNSAYYRCFSARKCSERIMRNLVVAGVIALVVTGLVPAVGAALMSSLAPMPVAPAVAKAAFAPALKHPSAVMLSNAQAVSWISSGHVVAP